MSVDSRRHWAPVGIGRVRRVAVLVASFAATIAVAAACSGSESGNTVPLDSPAPGVLYVSTHNGAVQQVVPGTGATEVIQAEPGDGEPAVVDIAPTAEGAGVNAIVQVSTTPFRTALARLSGSGLGVPQPAGELVTSCLDPHTAAAFAMAHQTIATADGTRFIAQVVGERSAGTVDDPASLERELISVSCPRWSGNRTTVATAAPLRAQDPSSVITIVQTNDREHQIGFEGCGTTPTSFSPDDRFLAVALTCYADDWENSGLYLVPVDSLDAIGDLASLTRLGDTGLFGRSAWHPDGGWIVVGRADAIERQNLAQNLGAQPVRLQVIELETGQVVDLDLADDAEPFAITWLADTLPDS